MIKGAITKLNQYVAETFDFTEATLSGSLDIIVLEQPDGQLKSSSFRVRFGKFKVLKSKEKQVILTINGVKQNVKMVLDKSGQAYFEEIREYKDIRKLSEDFNPSESEFDFQSPSEDDEPFGSPRDDLSNVDQVEIDEIKQQEDLKKMQKMMEKTDLSPKSNKGIVDSFMGIFKSKNKAKQEIQNQNGNQTKEKQNGQKKDTLKNESNNLVEKIDKQQGQNNKDETQSLTQQPNDQIPYNVKHTQSKSVDLDQFEKDFNVDDLGKIENILSLQTQQEQKVQSGEENKQTKQQDQNTPEKPSFDIKRNFSEQQQNSGQKEAQIKNQQIKNKINNNSSQNFQENIENQLDSKQNQELLQLQKNQQNENQENQQQQQFFQSQNDHQNQIKILQQELQEGANQHEEQESENEDEEEEEMEDESIELSICANLINNKTNGEEIRNIFEAKKVNFEDFTKDPSKILQNKNLLIRIKDELYPYELGICMLISQQAFKQQLPTQSIRMILNKRQGFFTKLFSSNKKNQHNYVEEAQLKSQLQGPQFLEENLMDQKQQKAQQYQQQNKQQNSNNKKVSFMPKKTLSQENLDELHTSNQDQNQLENIINEQNKKKERKLSEDQISLNSEGSTSTKNKKIKKTFRPKSSTLQSFNLKKGRNIITFTVQTDIQGQQTIEASIFLFKNNQQIVISDIDGTITRSDVLGQLFPMVGSQWVHDGIAKLYNKIHQNGYQILYLTARAIGQSEQTRNFIYNVDQDKLKLPPGPIIMSPDRIFKSFTREIIHKKPELFKIAALRDIANLYQIPSPFYAGFGNKDTDAIAYKAVGVSMGRIFITNPEGQVFQFNNTYQKTYNELIDMVDQMFPPLANDDYLLQDKYNNSNYWSKINQYQDTDIDKLLE